MVLLNRILTVALITLMIGCLPKDKDDALDWLAVLGFPGGNGNPPATPTPSITCPTGYVPVPANATIGTTSDFCVAKYEMKNNGGAVSEAAGSPWVSISQNDAKIACTNIGSGYHLITNAEWMTIARNIEAVASNWSSGTVGTGTINSGHNDTAPNNALAAVTDDADGCNGTGQTCPNTQKRTHTLSNGEVVWDLAGNVWEWVDWNVATDKANAGAAAIEFNTAVPTTSMPATSFLPSITSLTSANGIGQYTAGNNGIGGAAFRGGFWLLGVHAGIYGLNIGNDPTFTAAGNGFRCAYTP